MLVGIRGRAPSRGAVANAAPAHEALPGQPQHPEPRSPPRPGDSYGVLPRPCRALVLLNPQSGAGRALDDFQAVVQPMLAEADIATTVFVTGESTSSSLPTSSSSLPEMLPGCCRAATGSSGGRSSGGAGLDNAVGGLPRVVLEESVRGRGCAQRGWLPAPSWDPGGEKGLRSRPVGGSRMEPGP